MVANAIMQHVVGIPVMNPFVVLEFKMLGAAS
jgi:hypothetical protein